MCILNLMILSEVGAHQCRKWAPFLSVVHEMTQLYWLMSGFACVVYNHSLLYLHSVFLIVLCDVLIHNPPLPAVLMRK